MDNAEEEMNRMASQGAPVHLNFSDYKYAASLVPDEDEMQTTAVRYGTLLDPEGNKIEICEPPTHGAKAAVKNGVAPTDTAKNAKSKCAKLILRVEDLNKSVAFYTGVLDPNARGAPEHAADTCADLSIGAGCAGMKLLRRRSNVYNKPRHASISAYVVKNNLYFSLLSCSW